GAFTGYALLLILSFWLIKSATNTKNKAGKKIRGTPFNEREKVENNSLENKRSTINEQKRSVQILKNKGVLTESEYQEKIEKINEQIIVERVHNSSEYQNLKIVYESDLLSKEQFDEKTNKLLADYKEYYS